MKVLIKNLLVSGFRAGALLATFLAHHRCLALAQVNVVLGICVPLRAAPSIRLKLAPIERRNQYVRVLLAGFRTRLLSDWIGLQKLRLTLLRGLLLLRTPNNVVIIQWRKYFLFLVHFLGFSRLLADLFCPLFKQNGSALLIHGLLKASGQLNVLREIALLRDPLGLGLVNKLVLGF